MRSVRLVWRGREGAREEGWRGLPLLASWSYDLLDFTLWAMHECQIIAALLLQSPHDPISCHRPDVFYPDLSLIFTSDPSAFIVGTEICI